MSQKKWRVKWSCLTQMIDLSMCCATANEWIANFFCKMKSSLLFFFCLLLHCLTGDNKKTLMTGTILYASFTNHLNIFFSIVLCAEFITWLCANRNLPTVVLTVSHCAVCYLSDLLVPSLAIYSGVSRIRPRVMQWVSSRVCVSVCAWVCCSICLSACVS